MINITQYTHFPNTTELGKGNTHECYLLIKRDHDLSNLFPPGEEIAVTEVSTQKKYYFKSAQGNEFRINQLGVLYRDFDVHFGDVLTITNLGGDKGKTYVSVTKYNRVVLYVTSKGVEVLNEERLKTFEQKGSARNYRLNVLVDGEQNALDVRFAEALPKRSDSPNTTDYFKVELNGANLSNGTYALTLGQVNELNILEKSSLKVFPFDENMLSPIDEKAHDNSKSSELLLFQSDDATQFVWECIKFFNKNKELKKLFSSSYKTAGGYSGNYIRINGCYVAQQGKIDIEGYESIYTDEEGYINNGFDARNIEDFAEAINDVYKDEYKVVIEEDTDESGAVFKLLKLSQQIDCAPSYTRYLAALRTKPFMLLAGISGTGKSRIAREIAKACWPIGSEQRTKQVPDNFCMIQVKPNWHDSTELIGYISRINGEKYVVGDFTKFVAKAAQNPGIPYIVCLDEMNLAPVEQYFAEYLSVVESRRVQNDGTIETDPFIDYENSEAYKSLIDQLIHDDKERDAYLTEKDGKRLTIPQNLFVIGTVNMDETTFSFSRKVLDRAMTIEMNEVDLMGGLEKDSKNDLGYIGNAIIGKAAEGKDIYATNKALCDEVITYLQKVNDVLEGTPFKIAYRTRNEFLLYAVNRLVIAPNSELWQTLDEMTSMKILSRIEGDNERCEHVLRELKNLLTETVGNHAEDSASLKKIDEMLAKLKSGYTSYWA